MYEDWVIVRINKDGEFIICVAPKWSGLKQGDLVDVDDEPWMGVVEGCITINTEKDEGLMQFIKYIADATPRLKITSVYTAKEFEYDTV